MVTPLNPAMTCPRCGAPMLPSPAVQACDRCRARVTLRCGALLDSSVVLPAIDPRAKRIVVKSAGVVLLKHGEVAAEGVSEGTLDPVTGMIPMDQSGVLYTDIASIAVYRKIDVVRLVVALVVPTPVAALGIVLAITTNVGFLLFAAPFVLIAALMIWRAAILRGNYVRVAGRYRTITIRFDSPWWRRRPFHDELLRRAGLPPCAIP